MECSPLKRPPEEMTLFHDVFRAHKNAVAAAQARLGIQNIGQPKVLMILAHISEGMTQRELADVMHISPSTLTASLKSLEANGYVEKHIEESDGRCKRVVITEKGEDAVHKCMEAFQSVDIQLYDGFSEEEIENLKRNYKRMLQNLYRIGGTDFEHDR